MASLLGFNWGILGTSEFWLRFAYIIVAILVLMVMITVHEFGHYISGKILKFKINEFSIGFGKAIYKHTNKKTGEVFAVRMIPLGGYCAFEGEDKDASSPDSFNAQKPWKRLIVLFCGAFFNFIFSVLFSIILLCVMGDGTPRITKVLEDCPNDLKVGDIVLKVDGERPGYLNGGISTLLGKYKAGDNIELTIKRDGEKIKVTVTKYETEVDGQKAALIGIGSSETIKYSFGGALLRCVPFSFEIAWQCLVMLGSLLIGKTSISTLGGPITTVTAIAKTSSISALYLLLWVPLIGINLAVFNLLPIPALDGARMLFVLIEWIRKKPIDKKIEEKIHTIGLIVLFGFVIIVDILQLFVFKLF